jgi:gliding motility-associated-like protein
MGSEHRTIFLDTLVVDVCADKITLIWNSYINWNPSVKGYLVYMSENGLPYNILANLDSSATTYDHTSLTENAYYCYYIKAYNGNGFCSTSNVQCITAKKPNQPEYVYMRYVTVVDNEFARVGFFVDTTAYISQFKLQRSEDGINFIDLASIPATNVYSTINYDDITALVNEKSYYYRVVVIDSCNLEVLTSNLGRTIHLYGNADTYMLNHLEWTPYEDRDPQVYNIYREIEGYDFMHSAFSVQWGQILADDDVSIWTETSGRFDYMIEAALYDIYQQRFPFADTVYSNKILLIQEPRVYVANAFTPNGLNPTFKPIGVYVDTEEYYFAIYSRWGEKIFETTDVTEGWNGYYKGAICQQGAYTYYIRFKLSNGKDFQKRGSVIVLR